MSPKKFLTSLQSDDFNRLVVSFEFQSSNPALTFPITIWTPNTTMTLIILNFDRHILSFLQFLILSNINKLGASVSYNIYACFSCINITISKTMADVTLDIVKCFARLSRFGKFTKISFFFIPSSLPIPYVFAFTPKCRKPTIAQI